MINALENGTANGMQRGVQYLTNKIESKQRKIRRSLRQNRDQYWGEVAEKLEEAYGKKDIKTYYKLIKEAHGPQLANTTQGRQALQGKHMKTADGKTKPELEERWVQHFTALFNQPGEVDAPISQPNGKVIPGSRWACSTWSS